MATIVGALGVCASAQVATDALPRGYQTPRGCALAKLFTPTTLSEFTRLSENSAMPRLSDGRADAPLPQWIDGSSPKALLKGSHAGDYFVPSGNSAATQDFAQLMLNSVPVGYVLLCGLHGFADSK